MDANKYTLWQVYKDGYHIVIPIIQREYAQGRLDARATSIRNSFTQAIANALLLDQELALDFIYGKATQEKQFIPFDGQQRLTTLWVLHWLAALRSGKLYGDTATLLTKFSYESREGSIRFFKYLVDKFRSDGKEPLSIHGISDIATFILNQPWFSPAWKYDPTINGVLVMLQALETKLENADMNAIWDKLTSLADCPIHFRFESLRNISTKGDELYIAMNARGKQLTAFENFKADFLEWLATAYPGNENYFESKFDTDWLDIFWDLAINTDSDSPSTDLYADNTDRYFYNFLFWFADLIKELPMHEAKEPGITPEKNADAPRLLFTTLACALDPNRTNLVYDISNVDLLKKFLNNLAALNKGSGIATFFEDIFYSVPDGTVTPDKSKISLFDTDTNLFNIIVTKGVKAENKPKHLLMGCLLWLVTEQSEKIRLRNLRNILEYSNYEFGQTGSRVENTRFQLLGLAKLILNGVIDLDCRYNARQMLEENAKNEFRQVQPSPYPEEMNWLEDLWYFKGRLAIFAEQDNPPFSFQSTSIDTAQVFLDYAKVKRPFICNWEVMLQGLISQEAYSGMINDAYSGFALSKNDACDTIVSAILTSSSRPYPTAIRQPLQNLMQLSAHVVNKEAYICDMAKKWIDDCASRKLLDWRWYIVKYPQMRPDYPYPEQKLSCAGYYHWRNQPHSFLQRRLASFGGNGYNTNPFLLAVCTLVGSDYKSLFVTPGVTRDNYMRLENNLTLWPEEFGWRVLDENGTTASLEWNKLQGKLKYINVDMNTHGFIYVPGLNCKHDKYGQYELTQAGIEAIGEEPLAFWDRRLYDYEDRIQIGQAIARVINT